MVDEELFAAQKSVLSNVYVKGRREFLCCRKSYYERPELVILFNGASYIDGLTTCKKPFFCAECHKAYLYKSSLEIARVEEYIEKESLHPTMITLHVPHKITDNLKSLRLILHKATCGFLAESKNKFIKRVNKDTGSEGYILRNDITLTPNGWNPHCHIVNLQKIDFSARDKDLLVDEYAHQLESSGLCLSRLDKYYVETKSNLVHFRENSYNFSYLCKRNDTLMNLAVTNPEKYIELAQSGNIKEKIPLVKFKNGLKSKIARILPADERPEQEIRRISLPECITLEEIKNLSSEELKSLI